MAYVLWRVLMKKYSKVRLGIHRSPLPAVTPTGRHVRSFDESSWRVTDETAFHTIQSSGSGKAGKDEPKNVKNDKNEEFSRTNETRKSKTKRVKNYLKKCKDAALGTAVALTANVQSTAESSKSAASSKASNDVGRTSWYVQNENKTLEIDFTDNFVTVVTIDNDIWETVEELQPLDTLSSLVQNCDENAIDLSPVDPPPNNSNTDQCEVATEVSVTNLDNSDCETGIDLVNIEFGNEASEEYTGQSVYDSTPDLSINTNVESGGEDDQIPTSELPSESKCDVASLVDRLLGPLYPNFKNTRPVLVRQARDLLVCEYLGNIGRFESEFCQPAAALLRRVKHEAHGYKNEQPDLKNVNDIGCTPSGWPLSLGPQGICLHLGPLSPTLLRHGDCYLCVRGRSAPGLEVALVWRDSNGAIGSHMLAEFQHPLKDETTISCTGFTSITHMEMMAAPALATPELNSSVQPDLPELLQSLLVSVERAIERVPLDDLAFPCPQCHQFLPLFDRANDDGISIGSCACQCACVHPVEVTKKDSSIQTSPMFEFASSIPHIDSEEDGEDSSENNQKTSIPNSSSKKSGEIVTPKFITELPEKLLMSGITLPGTHDSDDRPLILCEAATIARAGLNRHDVARLLLYYASIPNKNKLENGLTILVLAESSEEAALDVLDKAMVIVEPKLKIHKFVIWRPSAEPKKTRNPKTLKSSKLKCYIVTDGNSLEEHICQEQMPTSCGGPIVHEQLEWVEFYKECEPFLVNCHAGGRKLIQTMSEIRADENPQFTRRFLNHQHRQIIRALTHPELVKLRRDGSATLEHLEERAQWLSHSDDVQMFKARSRRYFDEVHRVARRLEQLADQRRDRLKELARLRALEDETSEVLKWLREFGETKLKDTASLSRVELDQDIVRQKEKEFEQFYFIAMRYMDKGSDLLDEANQCVDPRANNLKELAQSLRLQLRVFGEALEETREYLEDVSKYFQLMDRIQAIDASTNSNANNINNNLNTKDELASEMLKIAKKIRNEPLIDKCKDISQRVNEIFCLSSPTNRKCTSENLDIVATSTPIADEKAAPDHHHDRRRSVSSFAYIYRCNHHAAGFPCNCWDVEENTLSQRMKNTFVQSLQKCPVCSKENGNGFVSRQNSLGLCNIKEVHESAENLLDNDKTSSRDDKNDSGLSGCGRCDESVSTKSRNVVKKRLHRTCSCQYFGGDTCGVCSIAGSSSGSASNGDQNDQQVDNMTEGGSDSFPKSSGSDELEESEEQYRSKTIPPVPVNSHLHCHASNLHLPPTTLTMDPKTQKTLLLIMREMIQTERDYVKSLDYIIENYIPELLREDIPQALRGQRNVVFGNVEKIYEFHSQHFLRELEQKAENPLQVGQCFLRHEKKFYLYALYNKNKPKSDSLMSEYGSSFFKNKQMELKDKMDLASYLLKPVQRMGKYALLLQQLMKACPPSASHGMLERESSDLEDLRAAEEMVRFQLRHGNDLLAMDSLRDCDVNLKEQGRLLRQNEFLVGEGRGGKKHIRQVFLFEELILFSKANRFPDRKNLDLYIYKNSIKTSDIGLTEKIGDSATKFEIWFRKRKRNDTFILQATSEEVKKAWTEEISQLLWKQAMKNREVRLQEMSSMGIGNKPCLDIRPSADQINDRSISIAQLSKTPRFRNSIAGPIIEPCRTNKRPHSIISVSSVSSGSTSSGGSGGTLGRLQQNNGYESCSKNHNRSTLNSQCSTESGIIADISLGSDDCGESTSSHWPLHKSNSQHSTSSSSKSTTVASSPQTEEPQVTLYHVPDDISINL